ncbi:MAG: hypothetical protein NC340_08855 [Ruminococcus flavefaciens]|nr:hypothetical protein [Ruminococcus flavefaciens]MCM1231395.1 hypothetical protein [Ruminococcus flavefaciens]
MTIREFVSALSDGYFDEKLHRLYGGSDNEMLRNRIRLVDSCERFSKMYPKCDKIRVHSVSSRIKVGGVKLFLSADKLKIMGDGTNYGYVSDEIPKDFEFADPDETADIQECFSGYSLCIAGRHSRKTAPEYTYPDDFIGSISELREKYDEREILRIAVGWDEQERNAQEAEALANGDIYGFFRLLNESSSHIFCTSKVQTAVLLLRKYLGEDGAVTAENNVVKAFVPSYRAEDYRKITEAVLGEGKCRVMHIRYTGGVEFTI